MNSSRRVFLASLVTLLPAAANVQASGVAGTLYVRQQLADKYYGRSTIQFVNNTGFPGLPMIIAPRMFISASSPFTNVNTGSSVTSKSTQLSDTALGYKDFQGNVVIALDVKYPGSRTTDIYYLNYNGTALSVSKEKIDRLTA